MSNHAPNRARLANLAGQADDEFYTPADAVADEMRILAPYLKGKRVFLPCDDFEKSHFAKFLAAHFADFGLRGLVASCYYKTDLFSTHKGGFWAEFDGKRWTEKRYHSGDFRSPAMLALAKDCDIIITNPPFSLFRAFYDWLKKTGKEFHVLGALNAMHYFNTFEAVASGKVQVKERHYDFLRPDGTTKAVAVVWLSSIIMPERIPPFLQLTARYDPEKYPVYENYNAINVDRLADIPYDFAGEMGVPTTILERGNPGQFVIVGMTHGRYGKKVGVRPIPTKRQQIEKWGVAMQGNGRTDVYYVQDGVPQHPFLRILIRLKNPPPDAIKTPIKTPIKVNH